MRDEADSDAPISGAWLVPLLYACGAVALGIVLPRVESRLLPHWMAPISVASATAILSSIASGMIALTGIVFSLAFVMVQFSATAYSPRLVLWLAAAPIIPHSMGTFSATFLYALAALAWVGRGEAGGVPFVSMAFALLLLFASILAFVGLVAGVGMLQITRVLHMIGVRGRAVVSAMYPDPGADEGGAQEAAAEIRATLPLVQTVLHRGAPRVVQAVDAKRMARIAREADAVVALALAVGDTAIEGLPIVEVYGARAELPREVLLGCIALGHERTFEQDPKWALRLLVDIAIKALSPAVNDPTTAVQALDQIESLLRSLATRRLDVGTLRDAAGRVRFVMPVPDWDDLLILGCEEVRFYGVSSVQVMRRLRALLHDLARDVAPSRAVVVRTYLGRVDEAIARTFEDARERHDALQDDRQGLGMPRSSSDGATSSRATGAG